MNAAPQELLKEYVKSQKFTSTAEIMDAMKEMFRDVIQTLMEVFRFFAPFRVLTVTPQSRLSLKSVWI